MLKLLDAMISLLIALSLTGWVQAHVTQGGDLTDQSVPNSLNASITFFTSHAEILEGSKFQFKCQIQMLELDAPIHAVELIFVPASEDKVRRLAVDDRLDQGLSSAMRKRMRMVTRRRWDAIEDVNIEEHYLTIDPLILEDQGMYVCQIKAPRNDDSNNKTLIASKHSLLSVIPAEESSGEFFTLESSALSSAPSHPTEVPTLGPITERFIVVKRGMNVVLECRDSDDAWVYWRKHGDSAIKGEGKRLRLFRVERWDSGLYYCSSNTTLKPHHNVTVEVEMSPRISPPTFYPEDVRPVSVQQAPGHLAILTCKVEAYPVPVVTWYRVTSKIIPPNEEDIKLHRLRIGDEYSFSISGYQDGQMLSSLRIHQVESDHFGRYRCSAKNKEGQDSMEFELTESAEPVDFLKLDISHEPDTKEAGKDNNLPISARNGFEIYGKKMFNAAQTPGNTWTNMGMLMTALNSIAYLLVHHASL
ncbi:hemicentin-2-like [Tigriopus californicus]|uniref:hemicentin-2-like n=1 Tax=Tigriopus californicus TaxID=6832 RepID=UPI0027DA622F|nr:hemicentin-2-like [Tigriopus californicus]